MKILLRTLLLALIWAGLWGDLSLPTLLAGAIAGFVIVVMWSKLEKPLAAEDPEDQGSLDTAVRNKDVILRINPFRAAIYLTVFVYLLVRSTLDLTIQTLSPRPKIRQAIVECQMQTGSALIATIVANSVSMTPGTLTVEISGRPRTLFVHTLRFDDASSLRDAVKTLERLAIRAFHPKQLDSGGDR